MTAYMFCIDSKIWVQNYCEYQFIWDNPLADGDLPCEQETGNSHGPQAMAIKKVIDVIPASSCWAHA